jgi:hypothetical protein
MRLRTTRAGTAVVGGCGFAPPAVEHPTKENDMRALRRSERQIPPSDTPPPRSRRTSEYALVNSGSPIRWPSVRVQPMTPVWWSWAKTCGGRPITHQVVFGATKESICRWGRGAPSGLAAVSERSFKADAFRVRHRQQHPRSSKASNRMVRCSSAWGPYIETRLVQQATGRGTQCKALHRQGLQPVRGVLLTSVQRNGGSMQPFALVPGLAEETVDLHMRCGRVRVNTHAPPLLWARLQCGASLRVRSLLLSGYRG